MGMIRAEKITHDENIDCYKIEVRTNGKWGRWVSSWRGSRLKYGRTNCIKSIKKRYLPSLGADIIEGGVFHSFANKDDAYKSARSFKFRYRHRGQKVRIIHCIIPPNCICYKGKFAGFDTYASTSIIKRDIAIKGEAIV